MTPPRHILVATDFSAPSIAALRCGREFARAFGATLHVMHVADSALDRYSRDPFVALPPEFQQDIENASLNQLERLLTDDDRRQLHAVAVLRTSASPASAIVDYAQASKIDMIVMGTHGRGGLSHMLLGSVADRVVRAAPCPVTVIRSEPNR
jgi:nucleotide-binding universal stress UspA family protein